MVVSCRSIHISPHSCSCTSPKLIHSVLYFHTGFSHPSKSQSKTAGLQAWKTCHDCSWGQPNTWQTSFGVACCQDGNGPRCLCFHWSWAPASSKFGSYHLQCPQTYWEILLVACCMSWTSRHKRPPPERIITCWWYSRTSANSEYQPPFCTIHIFVRLRNSNGRSKISKRSHAPHRWIYCRRVSRRNRNTLENIRFWWTQGCNSGLSKHFKEQEHAQRSSRGWRFVFGYPETS